MENSMVSVKEIADRFRLSEIDMRKVLLAYGNRVSYQFLNHSTQGYSVHESVYSAIIEADRNLRGMIFPFPEIKGRAKDSVPFTNGPKLYFLFSGGALVYIGMTHAIAARIGTHVKSKEFNKVAVFNIKAAILPLIEKMNIWHYNPPLNTDVMTEEIYFREVLKQGVWE